MRFHFIGNIFRRSFITNLNSQFFICKFIVRLDSASFPIIRHWSRRPRCERVILRSAVCSLCTAAVAAGGAFDVECMHAACIRYTHRNNNKNNNRKKNKIQRQKGDWISAQISFWWVCTLLRAMRWDSSATPTTVIVLYDFCFSLPFLWSAVVLVLLLRHFFYSSFSAVDQHSFGLCIRKNKKRNNEKKMFILLRQKQFHSFFAILCAPRSFGSFIRLRVLCIRRVYCKEEGTVVHDKYKNFVFSANAAQQQFIYTKNTHKRQPSQPGNIFIFTVFSVKFSLHVSSEYIQLSDER